MALDTQENLIKAVIKRSHRPDIDLEMNDFILLTEIEMKSNPDESLKLNLGEVVSEAVTSTASNAIELPTGFQSSRKFSITINDRIHKLQFRTPDQLNIRPNTGTPCFFTVRANQIEFDILPDEEYPITITYFAEFQPLTATNQANIVLTKYPNIYLYGCLRQVFSWVQDGELEDRYTGEFVSAIKSANKAEREARYPAQKQVTVAWSP